MKGEKLNASAHAQPNASDNLPLITDIQTPPWREAFLAGLPFLLIALSAVFSALEANPAAGLLSWAAASLDTALFILLLSASLLVSIYAVVHRFPLWTASWYSFAAWSAVALIGLWSARQGSDNGLLVLGGFGVILLGYLLIFRLSRLHALLMALFLLPIASQFGLESIPAAWEAALALFFGLLAALVAAYVMRRYEWKPGVTLAISANLLAGLLLIFVAFTQTEMSGFYGDSLGDALPGYTLYAALTLALYLGPLLFWRIIGRLAGQRRAS